MTEKCFLCNEKMEAVFLEKPQGTIIKIKKGTKTEFFHVCSECQKQFKNNLKQEIEKKLK